MVQTRKFLIMVRVFLTAAFLSAVAFRIRLSTLFPRRTQKRVLRRLQRQNKKSELARDLGFDRVQTLEQMRSIPVCTPDRILPYFERALSLGAAGQGIIGTSPIRAFIETSGTTGASRFVPINQRQVRAYLKSLLYTFVGISQGSPRLWKKFLGRPYIAMTSVLPTRSAPGNIPVGYGSAVMSLFTASADTGRSLPSLEVRKLSDWHQKMAAIFEETREKDISTIMGFPRYIDDFTDFVLQKTGAKCLQEIWPNLFMVVSGAVKVSKKFKDGLAEKWAGPGARFGRELHFCDVFSSTEGNYGVSWDAAGNSIRLDLLTNFYQFKDPQDGKIFQIDEIETFKPYELLITTPGGLINYTLGDLVSFVSLSTFEFEFAGRVKEEISLAGEQITLGNVQASLAKVENETGWNVQEFAVWAEEEPRRLHLVVPRGESLHGPIQINEAELLAKKFDEALSAAVDYYGVLRREFFYQNPVIDWVDAGYFRRYRALNSHRGQFKGKYLFTKEELFKKEYKNVDLNTGA